MEPCYRDVLHGQEVAKVRGERAEEKVERGVGCMRGSWKSMLFMPNSAVASRPQEDSGTGKNHTCIPDAQLGTDCIHVPRAVIDACARSN